jgi:type IV pilus assembly protein PilA
MTNSAPKPPMATGTKVLIGSAIGCGCLMFAIIPIGILAAIALPSFLNQANKAKQSEAKQYVGAIVRAEQAYFLENEKFTTNLAELARPVPADTVNYSYTLKSLPGKQQSLVMVQATAQKPALKSYIGAARMVERSGEKTTEAIVCMTATASRLVPPFVLPARSSDPLECPATTVPIGQ